MKKTDISALTPLSREQRQKADKLRLARLDAHTNAHENSIREQELSDLRQLKLQGPKSLSEKMKLRFLKNKYDRSVT